MSGLPGPSGPPRLSVSTQASSSFGTPPRRPQGARRRGVAPGLFVANPDSSDDDGTPNHRSSPVKTTTSPVTASSSGSGGRGAVPIPPSPLERSPATAKGAGLPLNIPSIPAPLSSPLPATPIFAQSSEQQSHSPVPPQPPPQPERHMRRAFTVPAPDQPRPSHEPRTASGSNFRDKAPSSPSRALPPLPSPPVGSSSPPASSQTSSSTHALPPIPQPPTPSSVQSMPERPSLLHGTQRVESPEHSLNSAVSSDGGTRSLTGTLSGGRARSGSHMKRMLQVTLDNDNFALVDITGMHTAQAIMEVVFSKLRFADDDYPGLRMYRTEFGESPDPDPLTPDDLLQLCEQHSDSKALLKFLVKQTGIPSASSAPVVPPANVPYRSNSHRRAEMPHINTDVPSNSSGRTPSRHSKEGSMSSASELFESRGAGGGTSASEWSEVDADGEIRRRAALGKGGSSSSRSPLAEATASLGNVSPAKSAGGGPSHPLISIRAASAAPSPSSRLREVDVPVSPFSDFPPDNRGSLTPTAPAFQVSDSTAGPSHRARRSGEGLGLNIDLDGMDEGTRALIEQFQREEEEARLSEIRRRRQEEADAELARKEQESERDEWQRQQSLQAEEQRRQQERDEAQAREVQAHERRLEEQRRAQEAATARWEANQEHDARAAVLNQSRRQNRDHWRQQGQLARMGQQGEGDSWVSVEEGRRSSLGERRPSDHQYPTVNPLFERPAYTSPQSNEFEQAVPIAANVAQHVQPRRPSVYGESTAAQDRLHDPRLHQLGRVQAGAQPIRRDTRTVHPFAYTRNDLQPPQSLNNTRSMDNLRPFTPQPPGMRYQFASVPPRGAVTPGPGLSDTRPYPVAAANCSPSMDRMQDGRYPEPVHSAPGRVPLQQSATSSSGMGVISFPSPQPRSGSPLARGSPGGGRRRSPDFDQSRPSSIHYDRSPPLATSPQTAALPRRPNTYYDEPSPPHSARTVANDGYFASDTGTWRPRSGSEARAYRSVSPYVADNRRASESSATSDDAATALPYARPPDHSWLNVPRRPTDMSDTASIAGTVSSGFSEATVRARATSADDEDDSADTARAGEYQQSLNALLHRSQPVPEDEDDEEEATLWLTGPSQNTDSPRPLHRALALRPSPSKPSLTVNTSAAPPPAGLQGSATTLSASDSATESEGDARVQRAKSFARPKDPNQWHMRPEPEMLYEHLDNFFPKIDLDKPIVEGASTPTTPASESSPQHPTASGFPPPPVHPSRTPLSPTRKSLELPRQPVLPPPSHPARNAFNKAENRKSIRVMADYKRKTMQRENRHQPELNAAVAQRANDKKVERRKSSSMWGHRVVEVTPSKMSSGMPAAIPESPSSEGNKPVSWVKGELIGKGSYGRVYIAMNLTTLDVMAVKQVELPATERDRNDRRQMGMIEALRSEIALLKDLYHPNIVAYLGCETSPEYLSIFLEYVPGGTIASIYRTPNQARFEEQLVKFFTAQILEGLAYLHQKHIWHRDLKGDNILVDADGICKISDFGISKQTADAYDSFGQATNMKGSVFWMAPEVIHSDNERTYSGKVDIWSLGCVVLEMWTGKRPWGDMEQVAAMFELFSNRARPPLPPDMHLSETALDFMNEKCLAKNPRDRPMAVDLLKHPFITEFDPNWTFAGSKIGKAVKKRGALKHHVAVPT